MGLEARGFRAVEISSKVRWTTDLTEIENYSLDKARAAGAAASPGGGRHRQWRHRWQYRPAHPARHRRIPEAEQTASRYIGR
jgi:hypothetical protein